MQKLNTHKKGFSLVEIIVVLSIIGIMASVAAVGYITSIKNSRDQKRVVDLGRVQSALEAYRSNNVNGYYPNTNYAGLQTYLVVNNHFLTSLPMPTNGAVYTYQPVCDGLLKCTAYLLSTTMERTQTIYTIDQNGVTGAIVPTPTTVIIRNTPTPLPTRQPTNTPVPKATATPTLTPTPVVKNSPTPPNDPPACVPDGGSCSDGTECCSSVCNKGTCAAGVGGDGI